MFLRSLLFTILVIWSSSVISVSPLAFLGESVTRFREDYVYEQSTDAFYKLNYLMVPWAEALTWCQEEGAELAFPATEQEVQVLLRFFANFTEKIWIALHDIYSEGVFISTNGKPVTEIYNKWIKGEPDDYLDGEDCVTLNSEGFYGDVPCENKFKFVCKKQNKNIVMNKKCLTYDTAYWFTNVTDRCYKLHLEPKSWHDAFRICIAEMARLADVNSKEEALYFVEVLKKFPEEALSDDNNNKDLIHVDASELLFKNKFVTHRGETLNEAGYDEWAEGKPIAQYYTQGFCGSLSRRGTLEDVRCYEQVMFVCEKDGAESSSFT